MAFYASINLIGKQNSQRCCNQYEEGEPNAIVLERFVEKRLIEEDGLVILNTCPPNIGEANSVPISERENYCYYGRNPEKNNLKERWDANKRGERKAICLGKSTAATSFFYP